MTEETNPFEPPSADIEPALDAGGTGSLRTEPRTVPAGHGIQWIGSGWELYKSHFGLWILMLIVMGAIFFAFNMVPLIGMLGGVLMPLFMGGWMIGCHRVANEGDLRFEDLFAGFSQHFQPLLIAGLIYLGATVVVMLIGIFGIAVLGGSAAMFFGDAPDSAALGMGVILGMLIIMALFIPVIMMIWFAPALITLNRVAPVDALKMSFFGCLRNIVPFLLYGVVGVLLLIVGAIPIFLGWLIVYPMLMCAVYSSYRDVFIEE